MGLSINICQSKWTGLDGLIQLERGH
jgi:hypothetical protein